MTPQGKKQIGAQTMERILPCPFCGGEAVVEEIPNGVGPTGSVSFSVGCSSPDEATCMGYQSFTSFSLRSEAVAAWNKRAPK